jgi:MSHA biogenesis protein MshI
MRFFRREKKNQGLLTIAFVGDGVVAASIARASAARPVLTMRAFVAGAPDGDTLEKAGREWRTGAWRCGTMLAGGEYQMLALEAPNVPPQELTAAVRWRLKDMLDFPVDAATVDVLDVPADKGAAVRANHGVFAIAAKNSVIEQRQQLFERAKIGLSVIDIPEMAQRNVSALVEPAGRGVAMLSFDAVGGLLTVTFGGELYLARRIDVTLAQLLDPEHEHKHASFDKITLELQRSLDHFDRQFHFISVSKLVLAPSTVSGLEEYLSTNLYTPVESLDLAEVIDLGAFPDMATKAEQQRWFLTLGAALRGAEGGA